MRFLAILSLVGLTLLPAFTQTTERPKSGPPKVVKKTVAGKTSASRPKPTATPAKKPASSKTAGTTASKPKPKAPVGPPKPDEKTEWERASTVADTLARVAALQKFNGMFPKSARHQDSLALIAATRSEMGNSKIVGGDIDAAIVLFRAAVTDAPKPLPDQLFTESLSKFPTNLFFRGERGAAFEIAKILEEKADTNADQLLNLASFYMSVESGAEARRVAEKAIALAPASSAAYQSLGLANRIDFQLDESANAYAKALELEPDSLSARRGLAEMKRSLGKADDAVTLYREILAKDDANLPAQTGLVLALFDAEKRAEAEAELAKLLAANPANVILLAGTAYWYAAHNEGEKAVEFAQKSIAADPRFIWSHVALARGLMVQKKPIEAEKVLLAARRYGNFPTLEYEIASARLAAGFYRDAADELAKSFSVKDGVVHTNLGGRVPRDAKNITELVGPERRASIFAPTAADDPENAARLTALLELKQQMDSATPNADFAARAADAFIRGDDKMKVHRQIFAASQLLDKKVALPKVVEIAKATVENIDAGLDVTYAASAVLASELYENRVIAATRGEYVNVPDVSRFTLSSILRGRVEEISGWALYEMDSPAESVIRLKRAVSVLPVDSAWWRSGMWRLGSALALSGKDAEALDAYIKCYKSGSPDAVRYNAIESIYTRVNGNTLGLENKIGAKPAPVAAIVQKAEQKPATEVKAETPAEIKTEPVTSATPELAEQKTVPKPIPEVKIDAAAPVKTETLAVATPEPTPTKAADQKAEPKSTPEPKIETLAQTATTVVVAATPDAKTDIPKTETGTTDTTSRKPDPKPTPAIAAETPAKTRTAPVTTASPEVNIDPPKAEPTPVATPEAKADPPKSAPEISKIAVEKPKEAGTDIKPANSTKELFPPVVISIPPPDLGKTVTRENSTKTEPSHTPDVTGSPDAASPPTKIPGKKFEVAANTGDQRQRIVDTKPDPAPEIKPCTLTASEESLSLKNGGSDLAVIIGIEGDGELEGLTAVSGSPKNISVHREAIEGMTSRAIFVIKSICPNVGIYQVSFELPCGKKEILVKVR